MTSCNGGETVITRCIETIFAASLSLLACHNSAQAQRYAPTPFGSTPSQRYYALIRLDGPPPAILMVPMLSLKACSNDLPFLIEKLKQALPVDHMVITPGRADSVSGKCIDLLS
jgi:hypothetical protein